MPLSESSIHSARRAASTPSSGPTAEASFEYSRRVSCPTSWPRITSAYNGCSMKLGSPVTSCARSSRSSASRSSRESTLRGTLPAMAIVRSRSHSGCDRRRRWDATSCTSDRPPGTKSSRYHSPARSEIDDDARADASSSRSASGFPSLIAANRRSDPTSPDPAHSTSSPVSASTSRGSTMIDSAWSRSAAVRW